MSDEPLPIKTLLEDVAEYLHSNPPANGLGLLDKGADADRRDLLRRIAEMLAAANREVDAYLAARRTPQGGEK